MEALSPEALRLSILPLSISEKHGRRIGYLKLLRALAYDRLGRYARYRAVRWTNVKRLVFICKGNICRSAYGEACARSLSLVSASAGLAATKNGAADPLASHFALQRGIDLAEHRATPFIEFERQPGDLLLCMEPEQADQVQSVIGDLSDQQVTLLGLWASDTRPYLQDPFGLENGYWHTCFDVIDSAIDNIASKISPSSLASKRSEPIHVMVAGAHSMGALGVIRSLGRGGYAVHAVADSQTALGLRSQFASHRAVHPPGNDPKFGHWLSKYVKQYDIRLIIAGGAIHPDNGQCSSGLSNLFPVPQEPSIRANGNKFELFKALGSGDGIHREHLPPHLLVDLNERLPRTEDLEPLGLPLFIKLDGRHACNGGGNRVVRAQTVDEALQVTADLSTKYDKALIQGFVRGIGVGVFLLRWKGRILARFMHKRLHEMPHTGGASSFRKSWWHAEILADAEAKLEHIDWNGVAMVEYRWNPETNQYYLMEMNLRFWGSIHLALYSGVDFPKLLADAHTQQIFHPVPRPQLNVRCRNTIPFEVGYLVSLWKDRHVSIGRKLYSILEAITLTLDPRVQNDLMFPGDNRLFWYRLITFLRTGH